MGGRISRGIGLSSHVQVNWEDWGVMVAWHPVDRVRDYSMSISTRRRFFNQSGRAMVASLVPSLIGKARAAGAERPRIKIGQLGVGHAHASKLSVFRQSADYEIVGLVEPDAELRKRAQSQEIYRGLPWMTQEQLLNVTGLQAILVEPRVRDLLNAAEACIAAGKHVHLDKPAGESLPQFRRILDAAGRQK